VWLTDGTRPFIVVLIETQELEPPAYPGAVQLALRLVAIFLVNACAAALVELVGSLTGLVSVEEPLVMSKDWDSSVVLVVEADRLKPAALRRIFSLAIRINKRCRGIWVSVPGKSEKTC
jgi:hypothetical protein